MEQWVEFFEKIAEAVVRKLDERRKIELIAEAVIEKLREQEALRGQELTVGGAEDGGGEEAKRLDEKGRSYFDRTISCDSDYCGINGFNFCCLLSSEKKGLADCLRF